MVKRLWLVGLVICLTALSFSVIGAGYDRADSEPPPENASRHRFKRPPRVKISEESIRKWEEAWISMTKIRGLKVGIDEYLEKMVRETGADLDEHAIISGAYDLSSYIVPAGNSYFMRRKGYIRKELKNLKPRIRQRFQLSALANHYALKKKLLLEAVELEPLSPLIEFRAYIGVSQAAFRSNDPLVVPDRLKYAKMALKTTPHDEPWKTDAYYLRGLCERDMGRRQKALELMIKAVELDEYHLRAQIALVQLLAAELAEHRGFMGEFSLKHLADLLRALESVTELTSRSKDFALLAEKMSRLAEKSPEVKFAVGYCYYRAAEFSRAREYLTGVIGHKPPPPEQIVTKAEDVLMAIERKNAGP